MEHTISSSARYRLYPIVNGLLIGMLSLTLAVIVQAAVDAGNGSAPKIQSTNAIMDEVNEVLAHDDAYTRNNPALVRAACEHILEPHSRGVPPEKLLRVRLYLVHACQCLGDFTAMRTHAMDAIRDALILMNERLLNEARRRLAFAEQKLGNFSEAEKLATLSLQSSRDNHERIDEADSLNLLGIIRWKLGELSLALKDYNDAILIYQEKGERVRYYTTLENCGIIHWNLKNYPKALEYYSQCLTPEAIAIMDNITLAGFHSNIAEAYRELGQLNKASEHLGKSLTMEEQSGNKEGIAFTLNNLGEVAMAAGNLAEARDYHQRALALHQEIGSVYGEAHSLYYLGLIAHMNQQTELSKELLEQAVALAEQEHLTDFYSRAQGELNLVYAGLGDYEKAWKSLQEFKRTNDSLTSEQSSNAIAEIESRLGLNQKRAQVALLTRENELREQAFAETLKGEEYKQKVLWGALVAAIIGALLVWAIYCIRLRGHRALEASNRRIEEANRMLEQHVDERTRSLRESQARYRSLVQHFPNGMVALLDRNGSTILAGGGAIERLGATSDTVVNHRWQEWLPSELVNAAKSHWATALGGQASTFECDCGDKVWWVFFVPAQGENESITLLLVELTELRKVQDELEQKQSQLTHSARLATLGEFSARIAHELNQPLQVMVFASSQLTHELTALHPDFEIIREQVEAMQEQVNRASEIIKSMRGFSRGESNQEAHPPINPCAVVKEAIPFFRTEIRNKQIQLELNLNPATPSIGMPHAQFQQILVNLISNAIHALKARAQTQPAVGGSANPFRPVLRVHLRPSNDAQSVILEVSDNGLGMDEPTHLHCLEPFFTTKSANDGTGLGLSIIHGFIRRQSGQIAIASTPGEGSTFRITLPAHHANV